MLGEWRMFTRSRNGIIIASAVLFVFLLGMIGAWWGADDKCGVDCWVRESLGLFFKGHDQPATPNLAFDLASYLAPFAVPFVALLATLQVALANFRRDLRGLRASYQSDHVVVCGIGEIGLQIVENLRDAGDNVVAIDLDDGSSNALTAERLGATVIKGNATRLAVLQSAGLKAAKIVVTCAGADTDNVDIALRIKAEVDAEQPPRDRPLVVLVELRDEWLFARLIDHDREPLGSAACEIRLFNTYQNTARVLLQTLVPPPVDAPRIGPFVIVGFGSMGREVARQVLGAGLAPLGLPITLLIVDREAESIQQQFLAETARIEDFASAQFVSTDLDDDAAENWRALENLLAETPPFAVAVCLSDDRASLHVGLTMRALLDRLREYNTPIYVRLGRHRRLGQLAGDLERDLVRWPEQPNRLRAFGSIQEVLGSEILVGATLDRLAQSYHEAQRSRQPADRLAEPAWREWARLAEQFKASSRRAADHLTVSLAQLGLAIVETPEPQPRCFEEEEIERLAELEHRRWLIERLLQGWRWGPIRDDLLRLNPLLVEWSALDPAIRQRNRDNVADVPGLLAAIGREIRRLEGQPALAPPPRYWSCPRDRQHTGPGGSHSSRCHTRRS